MPEAGSARIWVKSAVAVNLYEQAASALRLAESNPARAAELATSVTLRAHRDRAFDALSVASRARGVAALNLEDPDAALRHLRAAIRLARQANSAELAAEARVTLAFALAVRGRGPQALREIEAALGGLRSRVAQAQARAQRGAILQHLDRPAEALADFNTAMPVLRGYGDHVWVLRVLNNRAVLHGYLQQFTAAEADLAEAELVCAQADLDLSLGYVHQNLGWVNALRGEVTAALHYLDLAERRLREHDVPIGELLADRCQVLLSVRLWHEAAEAAQAAVHEFTRQRRNTGLPEARLLLALAAIADGQPSRGLEQARQAVRELDRQRRPRWAVLARFTVLRARAATYQLEGTGLEPRLVQLERIADDLADAGWLASSIEARLLAGRLALRRGLTDRAVAQLREVSRHRAPGPALQRAQAWYAHALIRWSGGDGRGATVATRTALRIMDEHRDSLGATDLRAHAAGHRVEVAEFGLRMALEGRRPARVLEWAEHGRASHLMLRPVRPPSDPALAAALSELRATASEIFHARAEGGNVAPLQRRQVALERQIRDHYRRLPPERGTTPSRPMTARALAQSLGDAILIEFVHLDGTLHAVAVADGRVRLRRLGPVAQAAELTDKALFALRRLARCQAGDPSAAAARALLADVAGRLDALLLRPVTSLALGRPLVLVPTGPLQSLPWAVLPSCTGRPVTVTPSAALWHAGRWPAKAARHALVTAGPGLPGADAEVAQIAALHQASALTGEAATVEAVMARLDGAKLAHLAAHGHIHPQNPLFTSLIFADGPLTVYDLKRLAEPPQLVVLAACDVGRPTVRSGDELLGLSATFLALGTRHVIAPMVSVPDAETAPLMVAFHRFLAAGATASTALASAQGEVGGTHPAAFAASVSFVSIGTSAPPG
jgi:tetratricopeptide (TPR) repeat protein